MPAMIARTLAAALALCCSPLRAQSPDFEREVLPHAPDAWIDHDKTRVGYEIPFNRHFYVFEPPRPLAEIDADLKRSMDRIKQMIEGLAG